MYTDIKIICRDCGEEFVFSAGEQEFYAEHGLGKNPIRCKSCREARKHNRTPYKRDIVMYEIVCTKCGELESIPFEPRHDRPVYCGKCYREINGKA